MGQVERNSKWDFYLGSTRKTTEILEQANINRVSRFVFNNRIPMSITKVGLKVEEFGSKKATIFSVIS